MTSPKLPNDVVIIPHRDLAPDTLRAVIEQFVSRDGPDPGHVDVDLDRKISQVMSALDSGRALLLFDQQTKTCNICSAEDLDLISKTKKL